MPDELPDAGPGAGIDSGPGEDPDSGPDGGGDDAEGGCGCELRRPNPSGSAALLLSCWCLPELASENSGAVSRSATTFGAR